MGVIGLLLGIAILIFFAYKGLGALPLTLLAGVVVILTNGMPLWTSFAEYYMGGYVGFFKAYFLIFASSAFYAKLMEDSGAAIAIGYKFIDWFGKKRAVLVVFLATAAMTYGGISLFVVIFAVAPIIMVLFREADIPRRLSVGVLGAGAATFTMTSLPGTPQLTNVIPTKFLGTTLTAAPVLGIIASIMLFVMCYVYLVWEEKRLRAAGEHFSYIPGIDPSIYEVDRDKLPNAALSFLPLVVLLIMIITMRSIMDSTALVVLAMFVGAALAYLLNIKRFKNIKATINTGFGGAISAIASPCAVVAFGTLVKNAPAFQEIVAWVLSLQMHPYVLATFATAVISGITGSSSGGLTITLQTIGPQLLETGANPAIMHRLMAISAGSLDSLPHSSGLFLMLSFLGLTHKEGYKFLGVTTVIVPAITTVILVAVCVAMGI
ncbi:GntP family permease [Papillibacter cinnamivorans]|uniref:H+/gluconate symporter n=1 Tax=Papillibacter cinnamivorans DSM 12816 TaxID=1122930 RepID=A0A1W2D248_9FIRM|nr:GntP family permease [Papillibacter cinnamivorans]SMC91152.1 H+/gluconate symporter [Papillibacter cinnamivorans DSM 12816]